MRRRLPWAAALVVLVGAAAVGAWLLAGGEPDYGRVHAFQASTSVEPRSHLFGDRVTALVELSFDRRVVDERTVDLRARFRPYLVVGRRRTLDVEGVAAVVRYRVSLLCLDRACIQRAGAKRTRIRPAYVSFTPLNGERRTVQLRWNELEAGPRVRKEEAESVQLRHVWRVGGLVPEAPTYRAGGLLAWLLHGAALLAAVGGLALLAPELRRAAALLPFRRDRLAGLPPLERALVLVERAGANGSGNGNGAVELRKALDLLARELRTSGRDELAGAARRLAWSAPSPGDPHVGELAGAVRRMLGGRR